MELTLNFEFAGIEWQVLVSVNDDWSLDTVFKVEVYDKVIGCYKLIPLDAKKLSEFETAMQDQLNDAIDDERNAAKAFAEDMAYEQGMNAGMMQSLRNDMRVRADEHRMRAVECVQHLKEGAVNE